MWIQQEGNSGESCYKLKGSAVATIAYDWSTRGTTFSPFFLFRFSFLFSSSFRWHFRRYTYVPFVTIIFRARVVMFLLYITGEVQVRTRMKTKFARSHRDRPENWNRVNTIKIYIQPFLGAFHSRFNVKRVGYFRSLIFNARFSSFFVVSISCNVIWFLPLKTKNSYYFYRFRV